jgi:2-iminobutanoate/2-iminopropanoate deaminase
MNVRMQQGKPAYSHVVTVAGPAKMIYIAGQLARDVDGISSARATCGRSSNSLSRTSTLPESRRRYLGRCCQDQHVTDYQAFSQCSDVRMRYFGVGSPTSKRAQARRC